jgi:hypothetical protein
MEPYLPTSSRKTMQWVSDAARRCAEVDAAARESGFATPTQCGLSELLRTAISAILCGHELGSWDEVGEGLVMVVRAEHLARQLEEKVDIRIKGA